MTRKQASASHRAGLQRNQTELCRNPESEDFPVSRIDSDAVLDDITAIDIMPGLISFGFKRFAHLGYTSFSVWLAPKKAQYLGDTGRNLFVGGDRTS